MTHVLPPLVCRDMTSKMAAKPCCQNVVKRWHGHNSCNLGGFGVVVIIHYSSNACYWQLLVTWKAQEFFTRLWSVLLCVLSGVGCNLMQVCLPVTACLVACIGRQSDSSCVSRDHTCQAGLLVDVQGIQHYKQSSKQDYKQARLQAIIKSALE